MQSINTRLTLNRTEGFKMVRLVADVRIPLPNSVCLTFYKKTHDGRPGNTWFFSVKEERA